MELYWGILFFWIGISVGSFLNMLIYRTEVSYGLRKKITTRTPNRSFCDYCGNQLGWFDNIPILSWLVLGGRSSCCQKKLPVSYPLLELGMGLFFVLMATRVDIDGWVIFVKLSVVSLLVFSALFDWKHMILPDFSTFLLIVSSVVLWFVYGAGELSYFYASAGSFVFLLVLHLVTKGKGMGMGDVKYAVFMGLLLGVVKTILAFYLAFIGGAIVGLVLIFFLKKKKNSRMSFGPFLILATLISWFWGEKILLYFYNWF